MALWQELTKTNTLIRRHRPPHQPETPILKAINLSVRYENVYALRELSFELNASERLAVVGPNGAGKSTLFKVIAGVLKPSDGQVHIYGQEPDGHICIAYVPQRSQVDWNFPVSVEDVVMMGRIGRLGLFRNPGGKDWEIVHHALDVVGMLEMQSRQISQLSGGQQQRMFIARALAQEAELMLMDEPLTGLDAPAQEDIFTILDSLKAAGVTVLVALHDLKMAAERFDRVMLLNRQLMGLGAPGEIFNSRMLLAAYGNQLHLVDTAEGALALEDSCCDHGEDEHA